MAKLYNICDCGLLCTFKLASLDKHAQLTRCFSAVAELLVKYCNIIQFHDSFCLFTFINVS